MTDIEKVQRSLLAETRYDLQGHDGYTVNELIQAIEVESQTTVSSQPIREATVEIWSSVVGTHRFLKVVGVQHYTSDSDDDDCNHLLLEVEEVHPTQHPTFNGYWMIRRITSLGWFSAIKSADGSYWVESHFDGIRFNTLKAVYEFFDQQRNTEMGRFLREHEWFLYRFGNTDDLAQTYFGGQR